MSAGARIVAATDGSCLGNPGPGGWAWAINQQVWAAASHPRTTNNLMEMRAVYELLVAVPREVPLTIQSDSEYTINVFTQWLDGWIAKGWRTSSRKPVANQEAIRLVVPLLEGRDVVWEHVYGHRGHPLNEFVDTQARNAAAAAQAGRVGQASGPEALTDYLDLWRREGSP